MTRYNKHLYDTQMEFQRKEYKQIFSLQRDFYESNKNFQIFFLFFLEIRKYVDRHFCKLIKKRTQSEESDFFHSFTDLKCPISGDFQMAHILPHGLFFTNKGERVIWSSWCSSKSTNLKQIQNVVKNSFASCISALSLQGFSA